MRYSIGVGLTVLWAAHAAAHPASLPTSSGAPRFTGPVVWSSTTEIATGFDLVGGLSAIELTDNGQSFIALGDRGLLLTGQIERHEQHIESLNLQTVTQLRDSDGNALRPDYTDSEALALSDDGSFYVASERRLRLLRYEEPGAAAVQMLRPAWARKLPSNQGIEALAVGVDGLIAMGELPTQAGFPVYVLTAKGWTITKTIPAHDGFALSAADMGPDGYLYILERKLTWRGFRSRIRRVGETIETLLTTQDGSLGNLEGLDVWRDSTGVLRATMVSDDNFLWVLPQHVVEFVLPDREDESGDK